MQQKENLDQALQTAMNQRTATIGGTQTWLVTAQAQSCALCCCTLKYVCPAHERLPSN